MTSLLADLLETCGFEEALDLRKASGLSRPNFHLDLADRRRVRGNGRLEVQFQRFSEIVEGFVFRQALARNIYLKALRDKPISFTPDRCGERTFHRMILPHSLIVKDTARRLRKRRTQPQARLAFPILLGWRLHGSNLC